MENHHSYSRTEQQALAKVAELKWLGNKTQNYR